MYLIYDVGVKILHSVNSLLFLIECKWENTKVIIIYKLLTFKIKNTIAWEVI